MGIDLPAFEFLLKANAEFGDFGSTVVLGRQHLLMRSDADRVRYGTVLEKYRPDLSLADIEDENVDRLIKALGGVPYQVMDFSAYEGAQVIHDLNEPLPEALKGQFDTVIDIGSLEHVFNIATAMKSMAEAVRVGGQFLCLNIANHHLGHGFWQFSPEVFFRTFCPAHGYEPRLADLYYQGAFHPLRDPQSAGRRLPIKTPGYTYVTFGARKTDDRPIFENGWPVQADYVAAWTLFLERTAEGEGDTAKAETILREALSKAADNPAYMVALAALLRRTQRQHTEEYDQLLAQAQDAAPDLPSVLSEYKIAFPQTATSLATPRRSELMTDDLSPEEFTQLFRLAKRVLWTNHDTRRRLQGNGINIVPANFYSEIPTHDELDASFEYAEEIPFDSPMFDPNPLEAFARDHLAPHASGFNPSKDNPHAPEIKEFFWSCPAFSSTDAIAYYAMIRHLKPKRILEIGSGYSTLVALEAVRQNGFGEVICIEPFPRDWLRALPIQLIEKKVHTLDSQFFEDHLADGDILFIDSTHTVKNGSDVLHLYLRVLPFLTRKLAVHVHDIYLPYPLPYRSATETQIYWTEQCLLYAYLLDNPKTRLLWSGVLGAKNYPDLLKEMMAGKMPIGGSSLWFSLNDVEFPAPKAIPAGKRIDVRQVSLALEDPRIPEKTGDALIRGRYEFKEREIARRMLTKGDRVIELGAGMGVVSLTIARLVGADAIQSFEANPVIIELARENAAANDLAVTFRHAIASPRVVAAETPYIDFFVLNSFEASSTRQVSPGQKAVQVPTTSLEEEIATFGANVLVFDIEGFETEIIEKTDLSGIDKLILEIHPKIIGMETCVHLIDRLEAQGLTIRADLAFGDVLAFERGAPATSMGGGVLFETLNRIEAAAQAQDWAGAMALFTPLETTQSENAYTQSRVSLIERGLGRDGLVRAAQAATLGSQDFLLFADLAGLYLGQGDKPKAEAALATLEGLFPRSPNLPVLAERIAQMA